MRLAFHATDNFLFAGDFQSRAWSNFDNFKNSNNKVDLNSIHIGMEYLLTSGTAVIPLRAGLFTYHLFQWDNADSK